MAAKAGEIEGRKNAPTALRGVDLWKLADLLWRFHETGDHEAHAEILAVHHVVVEAAEQTEKQPTKAKVKR